MPPERERKSAVERQREQRETAWIAETGAALHSRWSDQHPVTVLQTAAERLRSWGALAAELKRAGWQSKVKECDAAAALVDALAVIVEQYEPPNNLPAPGLPERPHPGIDVVGNPNGSAAVVEQRMVAAFGPELEARKASIESEVDGAPSYGVPCGNVVGVGDDENCALPAGHPGQCSLEVPAPTCTMGPECPVHPGIEVVHPANAPTDAVVGPEGGTETLPRDDATGVDPSAAERLAALPDASGTLTGELTDGSPELVINVIRDPSEAPPGATVYKGLGIEQTGDGYVLHTGSTLPEISDAGNVRQPRPRLTYAQLYARHATHGPADHRSVSQISTAAECGVRFALYSEPEREPAWWNVAGTALHTCIEVYERGISAGQREPVTPTEWLPTFLAEIERQREASGVPVTAWRTARAGTEGYDWWRVQGEEFLKTYVAWSAARHAAGWSILTVNAGGIDTMPVIEYPFALDVHGIRLDGVIDQAWSKVKPVSAWPDPHSVIEIIDLKFGSSKPADRFQIGVYAHALTHHLDHPVSVHQAHTIGGAYYLGRKGELHGRADNLCTVVPWEDVVHRTWMSESMSRAGIFMPHRSSLCKACPVNDLCPAGAS